MTASPDRSAFRSCEIGVPDPTSRPRWIVPARTLTEARENALDARKDGSAAVTVIQHHSGAKYEEWETVETTFARPADRRQWNKKTAALRAAGRVG